MDSLINPTHFKVMRVAKTMLIELIPTVSDYHLDSFCFFLYENDKFISTIWLGRNNFGFIENKIYSIEQI